MGSLDQSSSKKKRKAATTEEAVDVKDVEVNASPAVLQEAAAENVEQSAEEEEMEVLSHAEQRKRRKLEKKQGGTAKTDENGDVTTIKDEDAGAPAGQIAGSSTSTSLAKTAEPARVTKSVFGVWVGNLAFKTDADRLRTFFSECGTVTRINLPKGAKFQPNKGFAYIDFDSREALEKALEKSESNLDGRRLLIKSSTDYKGRPKNENVDAAAKVLLGDQQDKGEDGAPSAEKGLSKTARKILERQKNPPAPTLFIGNLGFDATIEAIQEAFEARAEARQRWESKKGKKKVDRKGKGKEVSDEDDSASDSDVAESGSDRDSDAEEEKDAKPKKTSKPETPDVQGGIAGVRQVRIGTFEDSGKCKGWAFVDFYTTAQATQSLVDGRNHYLNGRTLTVEYASADAVRRGGGKMDGAVEGSGTERPNRNGPRDTRGASNFAGKRKRDDGPGGYNKGREQAENGHDHTEADPEMPKQAFYRPPLALQPWREAEKVHKPNKAERQALREEKGSKGKRQKPGAALANAPRQTLAIQPAAGKKINFEE